MSASIFISFAAPDRKVASTLCKALESRGFKCWFSSRDILPGENFQVAIVRAIRKAKVLLLVFTANSNASEEMTKELALASQERLIVVPLRVEDVAPNEAFAYEFATRQWIDFFADWEAAIDQLSERLAQALPPDAQPDPALFAAKSDPSARAQALASAPPMKVEAREPEPVTPAPVTPAPSPAVAAPVVARAPATAEAPPAVAPAPIPVAEAAPPPVKEAPKEPPAKEPPPKPALETPAPAPKAAQPAPPKPSKPASPPVETPELVRDSIRAEAPVDEEPPAKKRTGLLAIAAVVVVALIGLGLAAPALFGKKPQPKPGVAAVAVVAPPKPVAPIAPVEAVAPTDEAADAADAEPEPVKAAPKPRKKAAPKPKDEEVPY